MSSTMKDFKERLFVLKATGGVYVIPEPSCLICKRCSDVLWDYTNGPYAAICGDGHVPELPRACCDHFEVDEEEYILREEFERMDDDEKMDYILRGQYIDPYDSLESAVFAGILKAKEILTKAKG